VNCVTTLPATSPQHHICYAIQALKAEIQQLKSNPALPAATNVIFTSSASDAESKLASYQQFMSEYIVNAQNQKLLAVREAELKAEKKFQERLEMLLSASGVSLPPSDVVNTQSSKQLSLYQKRNLKVAAAGEAGKSRWGSLELQKVNEYVKSPAAAISTQSKEGNSIFDQRNARILAAAAAGKSRWGNMEVERAKNSGISTAKSATAAAPTPAKTATLEDRVNLGARLLGV